MMAKRILKFSLGILAIALAGAVFLYGSRFMQYLADPEYKAMREAKKAAERIKREYEADPYGGETPEETLRLFIDALKKGDTDLAARYFVLDKQKEWAENISQVKEKGLLDHMIRDLEREKEKKMTGDSLCTFYIYNDNQILAVAITLEKGSNKKWKIQDM